MHHADTLHHQHRQDQVLPKLYDVWCIVYIAVCASAIEDMYK